MSNLNYEVNFKTFSFSLKESLSEMTLALNWNNSDIGSEFNLWCQLREEKPSRKLDVPCETRSLKTRHFRDFKWFLMEINVRWRTTALGCLVLSLRKDFIFKSQFNARDIIQASLHKFVVVHRLKVSASRFLSISWNFSHRDQLRLTSNRNSPRAAHRENLFKFFRGNSAFYAFIQWFFSGEVSPFTKETEITMTKPRGKVKSFEGKKHEAGK